MNTEKLLDLFTSGADTQEKIEQEKLSHINLPTKGIGEALATLQELWSEEQYQEEFNLKEYLSKVG